MDCLLLRQWHMVQQLSPRAEHQQKKSQAVLLN
jgi:hypothetical protein